MAEEVAELQMMMVALEEVEVVGQEKRSEEGAVAEVDHRLQELVVRVSMRLAEEEAVPVVQNSWAEEVVAYPQLRHSKPGMKSLLGEAAGVHRNEQVVEVGPRICVCLRKAAER